MCGIIGYTGHRNANNILIECLKRLDYRGYDSAGIAVVEGNLQISKEVGSISNLEKKIIPNNGTNGIGHTRWATHGKVTKENAHPQISCNKKFAIVHNGIIENFIKLRKELEDKGHKFTSQTDTEIIIHLIEEEYSGNLENAVNSAVNKLEGSYAIAVVSENEPEKIVGVRKESPLIVGIGDNENFISSDVTALLNYTNRVIYLDDNEMCVITRNRITILDKNNQEIKKEDHKIEWTIEDAKKSGFPHFMLKEIFEQPNSIYRSLSGRVSEIDRSIILPEKVEKLLDSPINCINIVACGTSLYAGLVGKYLIEELTQIPVIASISSEFRYFGTNDNPPLNIFVTQSGETADTLGALKKASKDNSRTLVITNVMGSTATRIGDGYIITQCGPEIGVAASKTFTSQILILFLIALRIGLIHKKIGTDDIYRNIQLLKDIPKHIRYVLDNNEKIIEAAKQLKDAQSIFYIGRGINYPLSLEGALKLKEISYIHAEGYAAGEIKHGPFALLSEDTPTIAIVTMDSTYNKTITNIGEIKARGSKVIAIADEKDTEIEKHADFVLRFPSNSGLFSCFSISVILQLLAYYVADLRKCPIDKPRNLAKSVTVD